MILRRIRVRNFRNYVDYSAEFSPGINFIVGGNGVGKTNLLEAVFLTIEGKPMRSGEMAEVIREGAVESVVEAEYGDGFLKRSTVRIGIERDAKKELVTGIKSVTFMPEDIEIIRGGPENRRKYLDETVIGLKPAYKEILREYAKTLRQRNEAIKMVKKGLRGREGIRFWNEMLVRNGLEIVRERKEILKRIETSLNEEGELWGWKSMEARYFTNMTIGEEAGELNRRKLEKMEDAEIRRGTTLVGPHRDEVIFYLDGRNLRRMASTGEQKMAAMLCVFVRGRIYQQEGKETILLLDDCFSELDGKNRSRLGNYVRGWNQVLVTGTDELKEVEVKNLIFLGEQREGSV